MLRINFKREQWKGKEHILKKNKIGKVRKHLKAAVLQQLVKINIS